jgi:hypothetical protein
MTFWRRGCNEIIIQLLERWEICFPFCTGMLSDLILKTHVSRIQGSGEILSKIYTLDYVLIIIPPTRTPTPLSPSYPHILAFTHYFRPSQVSYYILMIILEESDTSIVLWFCTLSMSLLIQYMLQTQVKDMPLLNRLKPLDKR